MNYFRRLFELVGKDKVKFIFGLFFASVSYTHLDVYKRQDMESDMIV